MENIFSAAVRLLDIKPSIPAELPACIPRSGPVLFVANHPFGVIDGLVMGHLALEIRPDTKIMTHSLLCQAPEARDYVLPVDFGDTHVAARTTATTRRRSVEWLRDGHALVLFPAGGVSTSQRALRGWAIDQAWHPFAAKLALLPDVTTIPICFHGQNSRLFHIASHVHYALRIALLFRETKRLIGKRISLSAGEPVSADELAGFGSREAVIAELRRRTLRLRGEDAPDPDETFRWPSRIKVD